MPSRKSDTRRSDASVAKTSLAAEDSVMTIDTDATADESSLPADTSSMPPPPAPPATASSEVSSEKKDKEKDKDKDAVAIEDLVLPKSIITRLAKGVLAPNTQIQANAVLALSKSAVVFINHLANAANEFTVNANKKTIMPADVFAALDEIDMGFMKEQLEAEFSKFNETQSSKRSTYRKKVAAAKKVVNPDGDASAVADSSMISFTSTNGPAGHETEADESQADSRSRLEDSREAKKLKPSGNGFHADEVSDAETVPDEHVDDEEEEEDGSAEEEEEEEEEEEDDENEAGAETQGDDALEERQEQDSGDEALDDEDGDSE